MPEMTFIIKWPDGSTATCYSPSLVVHDHLEEGRRYPISDFLDRVSRALDTASERVRAKYGFACTSAMAQKEDLLQAAHRQYDGDVEVIALTPPADALGPVPPRSSTEQSEIITQSMSSRSMS